ncbi:MAG: methionyl-tRNA synthetase [Watsoniomyces obsoletus]|nr:MAG: methionyl-tRNA synthetase [Watsoniomyces obsoletus]
MRNGELANNRVPFQDDHARGTPPVTQGWRARPIFPSIAANPLRSEMEGGSGAGRHVAGTGRIFPAEAPAKCGPGDVECSMLNWQGGWSEGVRVRTPVQFSYGNQSWNKVSSWRDTIPKRLSAAGCISGLAATSGILGAQAHGGFDL